MTHWAYIIDAVVLVLVLAATATPAGRRTLWHGALRVVRIFLDTDTHLCEMFGGIGLVGWGLWVLAFDTFDTGGGFVAFAQLGISESWFGPLVAAVGIAQLLIVALAPTCRRYAASAAAGAFFALACIFAYGELRTTAVFVHGLWCFIQAWAALRC